MRILVFHTDLDGIAVSILADYFRLSFDARMSLDYGFEEDADAMARIRGADEIVMADLSPSPEFYEELVGGGKSVIVFDHHDTSEWISGKPGCAWDAGRSGTMIFFDEYAKPRAGRFAPAAGEFASLVDAYDRWALDSPFRAMSEDLQRVFVGIGEWQIDDPLARHARFTKSMLRKLRAGGHFAWNAVDLMHIRRARESEERAYGEASARLQMRIDSHGRRFGVFSAWGKISMTCHRLLNIDRIDADYLVCAQTFHDKWGVLSLRSREGEFDLLDLAGAAGHHASAGAQLTPDGAKRLLRERLSLAYRADVDDGGSAALVDAADG